jgi:hypothetical protein
MSTLSALSRVKAQNRTCPVPWLGSREVGRTYLTSDPDMSESLTPQRLDFLGDYKRLSWLSSQVGHSFHLTNTLKQSLELSTSLLQASLKSKFSKRDLSLTLEWPTRSLSQTLHRWSPCVRYSWGFIPLDGLGCPGVTKVVVDPGKFVLSSCLWRFDSENWTRSWWSFGVD